MTITSNASPETAAPAEGVGSGDWPNGTPRRSLDGEGPGVLPRQGADMIALVRNVGNMALERIGAFSEYGRGREKDIFCSFKIVYKIFLECCTVSIFLKTGALRSTAVVVLSCKNSLAKR